MAALKPPRPKPAPPPYRVVNAPGGSYKVFPDGRRVFVAHGTGTGQGVGHATIDPGRPPADQIISGIGTGQGTGSITSRGTTPRVPPSGDVRDTGRPPADRPVLDIRDTGKPPRDLPTPGSGVPSPNPQSTPAGGADPGPFQPDAQYYAESAQNVFKAGQSRNDLDQQSAYAKTDFDEALRRMLEKQPRDVQAAREAANKVGLLYSGTLGRQEGDINTGYVRQQADMRQQYDRSEAAREVARRAIASGLSLDDAALLAASVDRQTGRDTAKADAGVLVPASTPKPPVTKPATASKPKKPAARPQVTQRRTIRTPTHTITGRTGQGFGEITVTPRSGGRKKSSSKSRRSRAGHF